MTTPESIVVSLDTAMKLKAAGYPQGLSRDTWSTTEGGFNASLHERVMPDHPNYNSPFYIEYDAPYAEEILRRLPLKLDQERTYQRLQIVLYEDGYRIGYWDSPADMPTEADFEANTLSDAAASMWIYLKEHHPLSLLLPIVKKP